jgi:hypothetical protein
MAFREVGVHEVREVLRHWLADEVGLRLIAERAGVDRKTGRRYVAGSVAGPGPRGRRGSADRRADRGCRAGGSSGAAAGS